MILKLQCLLQKYQIPRNDRSNVCSSTFNTNIDGIGHLTSGYVLTHKKSHNYAIEIFHTTEKHNL